MNPSPPLQPPPAPPRPTPWGPRLQRSPVTFVLIGVTGIVFLLQVLGQVLLGFDWVLELGLKDNALILQGQLWRLLTPVFIHAGFLHLAVNMYSLFALGPAVERFFGAPRFLAVYLLSGVSGVIFSLGLQPGAFGRRFGGDFWIAGGPGDVPLPAPAGLWPKGRDDAAPTAHCGRPELFRQSQSRIDMWDTSAAWWQVWPARCTSALAWSRRSSAASPRG
jgi:hypothetical protein